MEQIRKVPHDFNFFFLLIQFSRKNFITTLEKCKIIQKPHKQSHAHTNHYTIHTGHNV